MPILRILFGLLFVASAVLKLFPLDAFELILIKQVGLSWSIAPVAARILLLVEFIIGVSIAAGWCLRWMLGASVVLLVSFSAYLVLQIITGAGAENCGCFGELIPMDAPTSLAKNFVFLAMALALWWQHQKAKHWRIWWLAPILGLLAIPALFIAEPLPEAVPIEETTLSAPIFETVNEETNWDLLEGEKVAAILYAKCVHCKQLGSLLSTMDAGQQDRLRILVFGKAEDIQPFIEDTGLTGFPIKRTTSYGLMQGIDGTFPTVVRLSNGEVQTAWKGKSVNLELLSNQLQ